MKSKPSHIEVTFNIISSKMDSCCADEEINAISAWNEVTPLLIKSDRDKSGVPS
jgi:hypothetical protein